MRGGKMEDKDEIVKRYYQGESSLDEERKLKHAFRNGDLREEPMLAFQDETLSIPESLTLQIRQNLSKRQTKRLRSRCLLAGSAAAFLVLIISLRGLIPSTTDKTDLQLSDNLKKERFEDALRMIGNVLEEQTVPIEKVLYEDHKLIIAIE